MYPQCHAPFTSLLPLQIQWSQILYIIRNKSMLLCSVRWVWFGRFGLVWKVWCWTFRIFCIFCKFCISCTFCILYIVCLFPSYAFFCLLFLVPKGRILLPHRMIFWKRAKGGGCHFQSKNFYCRFWGTWNRAFWAWNW